ncbi:MAG: UDP-N-acetylmuramate--L-alanine ligase [Clostridia bacterium]|nr:UDP-N-acetylmuramate--L-alanine ligase [Clostridia bacterium]
MLFDSLDKNKPIHMIGIGGVSMSGLAEITSNMGYLITGSDAKVSDTVKKLIKNGITVYEGHHAENVVNAQLVVYTAAVKEDNPELVNARLLGIPILERSDYLGELMKKYKDNICVCGTHGKTTTTSMLSLVFINANLDPTIQVGADLKQLDGNYRIGTSEHFIVESCEYVESFLKFHPTTAVLLNIEEDHLDYYKNLEHIKSAFNKFLNLVPNDGNVILNSDDTDCIDVAKGLNCNVTTIGINNSSADWIAKDIKLNDNGCYSFVATNNIESLDITLSVVGYHNIYNALCVIATAKKYGISSEVIISSLNEFTGASRRFEYRGILNGAKVYDDYAHHPTEILATIKSALSVPHNKIWVVFQPHTYTRTYALFEEFKTTFKDVNELILTDIYAAREKDTGLVSSQQLAIAINEVSNNCRYISAFTKIEEYLKENVSNNDLVLTIGAGDITNLSYKLVK